ncbi:MAG: PEP-CTERM sorting domain-containing protein [Opitutus sp.]|nr:PEP-CTERM sorting domain-containing protein [Opitutus sp.]
MIPDTSSISLAAGTILDANGKTDIFSGLSGSGAVELNGGNLTLTGANTFAGSINGTGTLNITNSLTLASVINDANLTLNLAGTLNLGAFNNNTIGSLNLTGNSILDFSSSTATSLNLSNLNGFTLTINNWVNNVDYFYSQAWSGATANVRGSAPMNQITFTGFSAANTAWQSSDHQITPAPEPATYGAIFMAGALGFLAYRRRNKTTATNSP